MLEAARRRFDNRPPERITTTEGLPSNAVQALVGFRGRLYAFPTNSLYAGGLWVRTSYNPVMQQAAEYLEKGYDGQAAYVILAHLSESNNLPELARVSAEYALRDRMSLLGNRILLATQDEPMASIVF